MFTMTKALEEALLQHFIYTKLDIAYAIKKPFPFFEALRDNSFITDKMYKESLEACQNLIPLSKVVHNVLTSLEQTFQPLMLRTLFSQVNLHEYPSLSAIFRSFKNAASNNLAAITDNEEDSERMPSISPDTVQTSSRDPQRNDKDSSPEMPHSSSGPVPVIKDNLTLETKEEEDSGEQPPGSPGTVQVVKDDSPAPNDLEMPQEAPSTPANKKAKKRKRCIWSAPKRRCQKKRPPQGVASPGHGAQEKPKVVAQRTQRKDDSTRNLKMVTRAHKSRTEHAQTSISQQINKGASKTNGRKRTQKMPSTPPRTTQGKSKDDTMDFLSPTLPVTCGKAKGILFKKKMKQGASGKCIQNEAGDWFTPREFLIEGERAKSKDWKKTIWCKAKTLRFLEQKGLLLCTSHSNLKKRVTSR